MLVLFLVELYGLVQNFLFYRQVRNSWKVKKDAALPEIYPTVDIFVPVVNEPLPILKKTVMGCLSQDYPRENFKVHVLDDGPRHDVKILAEELGCNYIRRNGREHAKAGNLNNAGLFSEAERYSGERPFWKWAASKSRYLNRVLSAGLAPESRRAYLKQRARWAKGAMQVFLKDNPLCKKRTLPGPEAGLLQLDILFFSGDTKAYFETSGPGIEIKPLPGMESAIPGYSMNE
jgi:cellulose synthase/poly-beta-1,6-N-acetylglucosamine synthase-like glycosyltransferase